MTELVDLLPGEKVVVSVRSTGFRNVDSIRLQTSTHNLCRGVSIWDPTPVGTLLPVCRPLSRARKPDDQVFGWRLKESP